MNKFYIVPNRIKDVDLKVASLVEKELLRCDPLASVTIEEANMNGTGKAIRNIPAGTECIIVLGGDGTLIRVAKDTVNCNIPLIGVNLGTLGYLAEVELSAVSGAMEKLVLDRYHLEERMMLAGIVTCNGKVSSQLSALNDIVLIRRGDFQIIGYRIYVNGQYLNDFYGDGIILSTPTGSTGYNLSAGGPIVEPKAQLIVLTPVSPHSLSTRSIILSVEDRIEVEILPPKGEKNVEVGACFDGGDDGILHSGDKVEIFRSPQVTRIIKLSDAGFLEVLHQKMSV